VQANSESAEHARNERVNRLSHSRIYVDINGISRSLANGVHLAPLYSGQTLCVLANGGMELHGALALSAMKLRVVDESLF
jgi:hypothetical protein